MGFFSRAVGAARNAVGKVGRVMRKVADFTSPVINKIGTFAAPIAMVAGGLAGAFHDMPNLNATLDAVGTVAGAVNKYAPKASDFMKKAGAYGDILQSKYG